MIRQISIAFALAAVLLLPDRGIAEFKKTKVAVLDFSIQGDGQQTRDMGKIVAEWLITGLVETGRFDVIERRLLEKILEEHALGLSGAVDPDSVAQLGKLLGVKTIVSGTILSFEGSVEINARLINVETASIIAAERVRASSATRLNELVAQIIEKIVQAFPLEGYVVMRANDKVTIDLGRKIGVRPRMKFIAFKEGKVIRHPKTGEVLDVETIEIGEIEVAEVRDKTATGIILKESAPGSVSYGSMVRSAVTGQLVNIEEESPRGGRKSEQRPDRPAEKPKVTVPPPTF